MGQNREYNYIGKRISRVDARDKVTGRTRYFTDIYLPDMLRGKALLSRYAHARIVRIDVERARNLPGVEAVLTARDVPGHNGSGYVNPNWPVLCEDRVRYQGDVVALVAAVDEANPPAQDAYEPHLSFIEVEVDRLEQLAEVCRVPSVDIVLLDNFSPGDLRKAIEYRDENDLRGKLRLEASGGVTLENVAEIAATGVDRISVGALTHSAPNLDIGLDS